MSALSDRARRVAAGGESGLLDAVSTELEGLDPHALLAELRASDEWRFVLYEIQGKGCAKPRELAAMALEAMGRELIEEGGI
jgi:hypothetical protein